MRREQGGARNIFVLSGGGSRGGAQVGMLRALLGQGIRPDVLVGGSVGALNAAFIAQEPSLDRVEELADLWLAADTRALTGDRRQALLNIARRRSYLFEATGIRRLVARWVDCGRLEDLAVPTVIATTDLASGRRMHHREGDLADLIAASSALPGIFPPVALPGPDGRTSLQVDAGIAENVPVSAALDLARPGDRVYVLDITQASPVQRLQSPLDVLVAALMAAIRNQPEPDFPDGVELVRLRIDDSFHAGGVLDFRRVPELLRLGEESVRSALGPSAVGRPALSLVV